MISNPLTRRHIKINGPTYKKLINAGYEHHNDILVLPEPIIVIQKVLNPPFPTDVIPRIYSFLEFKDIMKGYFVNRVFATAISHGSHMYAGSIIQYMLTMKSPGKVYRHAEQIFSDHDILMYLSQMKLQSYNPYWKHISDINIYLGRQSRSWALLNIFLLIKTNRDILSHIVNTGVQDWNTGAYRSPKVFGLSYDTKRLLST